MEQINWTAVLTTILTIIGAILGSAGLWTFLDHTQQRKADKNMQDSEMMKELKAVRSELTEVKEAIDEKLNAVKEAIDENEAKASRIRILKFADEIFMEMNHSKDAFDQCLSDVTFYEKYTKEHPRFQNHQTQETVEYIKEVYHERMQKKDFARYGAMRNGGV